MDNITIVAAMSLNRVIGKDNKIPWKLSNDLKRFKALTSGKTVLMGRKTWDSLPVQPLPNRDNWVLTRSKHLRVLPNASIFNNSWDVLDEPNVEELMVIGGSEIYRSFIRLANTLEITLVHTEVEGDAYFPQIDETTWKVVSRENHDADEKNEYPYSFITYKRNGKPYWTHGLSDLTA